MKRKASIATAAVFLAVLFGFSLLHLALPDREVSRSERRRLAQLPPLSSGFSDKLEEYMLDQFPLREQLRTVNSLVRLYGLGQADIHGIYLQGGGAFRMDGPLQEKQVRHAAAVFSAVQEKYFPSLPAHYVIVPDKNAKAETGRPRLDTEALRGIVRDLVDGTADANQTNANGLIEWLTDYTNDIAGKTNPFDRALQKVFGRKSMKVVEWLNGRAKSNAILGNLNSAIAQWFNLPNGVAIIKNPIDLSKGMADYVMAL